MAFVVLAKIEWCWVPGGADGSMLGARQSNFPGYTALPQAGTVPSAQSASDQCGEWVAGGNAPTDAQFQAALTALAADLYTQAITPGSVPGFTAGKLTDLMRNWANGGA